MRANDEIGDDAREPTDGAGARKKLTTSTKDLLRRLRLAVSGLNPLQGFFAGGIPGSTLRSNAPSLSAKNTHSEAVSHEVVCR